MSAVLAAVVEAEVEVAAVSVAAVVVSPIGPKIEPKALVKGSKPEASGDALVSVLEASSDDVEELPFPESFDGVGVDFDV